MCTCIYLNSCGSYFGRNMDIHYSFNEQIIYVNKGRKFSLKNGDEFSLKYSLLGIGTSINDYPLFSDVMNEKGLAIASLNFINNAYYFPYIEGKENITPFELPIYLLGTCSNIEEVKEKLKNINLLNVSFSDKIPLAYLHFMISDLNKSIVVESNKDGLKVFDNELNVLTNNPEFSYHKNNIYNYLNLSIEDPSHHKFGNISYGQGLIGLPGDYSSMSRFIKAYFVKENIVLNDEPVNQFFYSLDSVLMPLGLVKVKEEFEYTRYQSCYDLKNKKLYYRTYFDRNIKCIKFDDFNNSDFIHFRLIKQK